MADGDDVAAGLVGILGLILALGLLGLISGVLT